MPALLDHRCASCGAATAKLLEHRSEAEPGLCFCPEHCPGGCDSPEEHDE